MLLRTAFTLNKAASSLDVPLSPCVWLVPILQLLDPRQSRPKEFLSGTWCMKNCHGVLLFFLAEDFASLKEPRCVATRVQLQALVQGIFLDVVDLNEYLTPSARSPATSCRDKTDDNPTADNDIYFQLCINCTVSSFTLRLESIR